MKATAEPKIASYLKALIVQDVTMKGGEAAVNFVLRSLIFTGAANKLVQVSA